MKLKQFIAPIIVGLFLAGGLITAQYYTAPDQGGTGQDSSVWTGVVRTDAGVWSTTTVGSGTVTSVDMSVPTGLAISGNPITATGTLALTYDTGYSAVLDASTTNWETAFGWGDWSGEGFIDNTVATLSSLTSIGTLTGLTVSGTSALATTTITGDLTVNTNDLFIDTATGKIGIGTVSPTRQLDIEMAGSDIIAEFVGTDVSENGYVFIGIIQNAGSNSKAGIRFDNDADGYTMGIDGSDGDKFKIADSLAADFSNPRLVIQPDGNVGIGTSSPSQMLTVGDDNQFTVTSAGAIDATSLTLDTALADAEVSNTLTVTGYMQDEDINTFDELQAWVTDATLVKVATTTDTKVCTWIAAESAIACETTAGAGTVTSVDMSVPTGLAISGNPITGAGTLALTYDTGYSAVLDASTTEWNAKWDALTDMVLTDNYIYVGDASNDPVGVAMSNDCTIASDGVITCDHDALANFLAAEHVDWAGASAGTIHTDNYIEGITYTATNPITLTGTVFSISATTSAAWATLITDEEGTGKIVYNTSPTFLTGITVPNDSISAAELSEGDAFTWTGTTHSFAGVTNLLIPAVANSASEIAIDTTNDDQFIYYGDVANVLTGFNEKCFNLENASTTDDNIAFWHPRRAILITDVYCKTSTSTIEVVISDGTNVLETVTCDVDGQADDGSIANGAFIADERMEFDIGAVGVATNWLNFCISYTITAD